jgi:tetratricopeptide (TPR) repeat protein
LSVENPVEEAPQRRTPLIWPVIVIGLVLVISVLVASLNHAFGSTKPSDDPLDGSIVLRSTNDYISANQAAANFAKDAFTRLSRGEPLTAADKQNLRQAARLYDSMLAFRPASYSPALACGECLHALDMHDQAITKLRQFIAGAGEDPADQQLKVNVADSHQLIANSLVALHDYKAALVEANKANDMYPNTTAYLVERASAELQLNDRAHAKTDLEQAVKVSAPNDPTDTARTRAIQMLHLIDSKT